MRKEILEALTTKFAGVSATILGRIADKLAKTVTTAEQVKTAVDGVTFQQVLESYGDSRATEATQTAVSNYEKKHGLKDGKKVDGGAPEPEPDPKPDPNQGGDDLAKTIAAAVAAAVKPLHDEIANFKQGRVTETRKQQFGAVIDKLPEKFRKGYSRISVDTLTDDEFKTLLDEANAEVEAIVSETSARGAVLGRPLGNGGKGTAATHQSVAAQEATEEEAAAVAERLNI